MHIKLKEVGHMLLHFKLNMYEDEVQRHPVQGFSYGFSLHL